MFAVAAFMLTALFTTVAAETPACPGGQIERTDNRMAAYRYVTSEWAVRNGSGSTVNKPALQLYDPT